MKFGPGRQVAVEPIGVSVPANGLHEFLRSQIRCGEIVPLYFTASARRFCSNCKRSRCFFASGVPLRAWR